MPHVTFTPHLSRFFPELEEGHVVAATVAELLAKLEERHPGLRGYLVDDRGRLRKHVNVYVGSEMVKDREALSDEVDDGDDVYIFQALSGG